MSVVLQTSSKMEGQQLQVRKDFFELGESYALCQSAFNPLKCQSKMYGGEFERSSLEIDEGFKNFKSLLDSRTETAQLYKELLRVTADVHRLQGKILTVFAVGKNNSGYDV